MAAQPAGRGRCMVAQQRRRCCLPALQLRHRLPRPGALLPARPACRLAHPAAHAAAAAAGAHLPPTRGSGCMGPQLPPLQQSKPLCAAPAGAASPASGKGAGIRRRQEDLAACVGVGKGMLGTWRHAMQHLPSSRAGKPNSARLACPAPGAPNRRVCQAAKPVQQQGRPRAPCCRPKPRPHLLQAQRDLQPAAAHRQAEPLQQRGGVVLAAAAAGPLPLRFCFHQLPNALLVRHCALQAVRAIA